jgi:hypothetical protein
MKRAFEFVGYGACGAFLAALLAVSVQFAFESVNWWFVGIAASFGFLLAGFLGEQAVDWLKEIFWRW